MRTPVYEATTDIQIQPVENEEGNTPEGMREAEVATQQHVVTSQKVTEEVIKELDLDMSTGELLSKHVTAEVVPDTTVLRITVKAESAEQAADIANTYASAYLEYRGDDAGTVLQEAGSSSKPITPNPLRDGGLAVVVGLLVGIGLALLRDHFDDTIHDDLVLRRIVKDRPVLGSIPYWGRQEASAGVPVTLNAPRSPAADAYRELAARVRKVLASPGGARERKGSCILVTSSEARTGTTSTAINLSIACAEAGLRVLLIDANLRDPAVADRFGLSPRKGLADVLAANLPASDGAVQTETENLWVLPAGTTNVANPAALLASQKAEKMLADLTTSIELVVLDCGAADVADTIELSSSADLGLLVALAGSSRGPALVDAVGRLEGLDVPVGVVCNDVRRSRGKKKSRKLAPRR